MNVFCFVDYVPRLRHLGRDADGANACLPRGTKGYVMSGRWTGTAARVSETPTDVLPLRHVVNAAVSELLHRTFTQRAEILATEVRSIAPREFEREA